MRKIRTRLQPALIKEATDGDEMAYRRLMFLDQTLQSMFQRFEEENDAGIAEGDSEYSAEGDSLAYRLAHVDLSKRALTASALHGCINTRFIRQSII